MEDSLECVNFTLAGVFKENLIMSYILYKSEIPIKLQALR